MIFSFLPCFYDKNECTITHLLTVEYPDTETFFKILLKTLKSIAQNYYFRSINDTY